MKRMKGARDRITTTRKTKLCAVTMLVDTERCALAVPCPSPLTSNLQVLEEYGYIPEGTLRGWKNAMLNKVPLRKMGRPKILEDDEEKMVLDSLMLLRKRGIAVTHRTIQSCGMKVQSRMRLPSTIKTLGSGWTRFCLCQPLNMVFGLSKKHKTHISFGLQIIQEIKDNDRRSEIWPTIGQPLANFFEETKREM